VCRILINSLLGVWWLACLIFFNPLSIHGHYRTKITKILFRVSGGRNPSSVSIPPTVFLIFLACSPTGLLEFVQHEKSSSVMRPFTCFLPPFYLAHWTLIDRGDSRNEHVPETQNSPCLRGAGRAYAIVGIRPWDETFAEFSFPPGK
jgi:hypothetical protein